MKKKTLDTFILGMHQAPTPREPRPYVTERHKRHEQNMLEIATRKANGLARLEIALTKYLCDQHGQQKEAVSAAIMRCREAQQDADFADLWKLLETAGANTNWP